MNKLELLNELFAEKPISPVALSALLKKQKQRKHTYPTDDSRNLLMAREGDFNWDEDK